MRKHGVLYFQDGDEAFEFIQSENNIDLFITDQRHPGKSAADLVDYMDKNHPETKTVITSGHTRDPNIDEVDIFLQKPYTINAFAEKIRSLLNQYQER